MVFTIRKLVMLVVLMVFVLCLVKDSMSKPNPGLPSIGFNLSGCQIDSKLQETCQRCAKATKSHLVYPMCCTNEDDVYHWCQRYLGYGIH